MLRQQHAEQSIRVGTVGQTGSTRSCTLLKSYTVLIPGFWNGNKGVFHTQWHGMSMPALRKQLSPSLVSVLMGHHRTQMGMAPEVS